jgi:hypothetical protein
MIARLHWQNATGRLLEGWRVLDQPLAETRGLTDLPFVMVQPVTFSESYRPGGRDAIATAAVTYSFLVAVKHAETLTGLLSATAKVLNSIEKRADAAGLLDTGLLGTLMRPFDASVGGNLILDVSFGALLTISATPRPYRRGQR